MAESLVKEAFGLKSLGKFEEAIEKYDEAIALKPDHAEAYYDKGNCLYLLQDFDRAIVSYDRATDLKKRHADAYYGKGVSLQRLGKYDEAIQSSEKAIAIKPGYYHAFYNIATCQKNQGKYKEAIENYDKAITLNPDYTEAYYSKGNCLYFIKKYKKAIKCYAKVISLKPDYIDAHFGRAITLKHLERYEEALESFEKVINLQPENAKAFYQAGSCLNNLGKYKEAMVKYDKAIIEIPNYASAYYGKGNSAYLLKMYEEAISLYEKTISLEPDHADAHYGKGHCLYHLQKYEESIAEMEKSLKLKPNDALCYWCLGKNYQALGKEQETTFYLKLAQTNLEVSKQYYNSKQLSYIDPVLHSIVELDKAVERTEEVFPKNEENNPTLRKFRTSIGKLQEKRTELLNSLDFEKGTNFKKIDPLKDDFQLLMIRIKDHLDKIKNKGKGKKIDDFQKKLVTALTKQGLHKKDIEKIKRYLKSFQETISSVYRISQAIESGEVKLDDGIKMADFLSAIDSFFPFFENAFTNAGISNIGDFSVMKEFKDSATKMLNLASDVTSLNQMTGEIASEILQSQKVQKTILESSDEIDDEVFESRLKKLLSFCEPFGEDLDSYSYTYRYKGIEKKLANNDATIVIELMLKDSGQKKDFKKLYATEVKNIYDKRGEPIKSSTSLKNGKSLKPRLCCNIF